MNNFGFYINEDGFTCLAIKNNFTLTQTNKMCKEIEEKLSSHFGVVNCQLITSSPFIVFDIDLLDDDFEEIGTIEFMCELDDIICNDNVYELVLIHTNSPSDLYSQEDLDDARDIICNILLKEMPL